jgi:hypothetical protein
MAKKKAPIAVQAVAPEPGEIPTVPAVDLATALSAQEQLERLLTTDDPWELWLEVKNLDLDDRAAHFDRFVALLVKCGVAERAMLIDKAKESWPGITKANIEGLLKEKATEDAALRQSLVQDLDDLEKPPELMESIKVGEKEYIPPSSMLADTGTILFATSVEEYGTDEDLFKTVRDFIIRWVDVRDPAAVDLFCAYTMMTWIFDRLDTVPYLRALGDFGSGKTRLITVVGSLCFRALMCGGATTPSPIFRIVDRFKGTLIIDEADFSQRSDTWSELLKIFNTGYTRGWPVLRSEKSPDDGFDVRAYDCFSPKILAGRERLDEALESRCFSYTTSLGLGEIRAKLSLATAFRQEAQSIRNQLLLWRLRNWARIVVEDVRVDGVEPRVNQILQPLLALFGADSPLGKTLIAHAQSLGAQLTEDRRNSREGEVLTIVKSLALRHNWQDGAPVSVNEVMGMYNVNRKERDHTNEWKIGRTMTKLGFKPGPRVETGGRAGRSYLLSWARLNRQLEAYGFPRVKVERTPV